MRAYVGDALDRLDKGESDRLMDDKREQRQRVNPAVTAMWSQA